MTFSVPFVRVFNKKIPLGFTICVQRSLVKWRFATSAPVKWDSQDRFDGQLTRDNCTYRIIRVSSSRACDVQSVVQNKNSHTCFLTLELVLCNLSPYESYVLYVTRVLQIFLISCRSSNDHYTISQFLALSASHTPEKQIRKI